MKKNKADFNKSADLMLKTLRKKNKIIFCGNGGSAADCVSRSCRAGW